MKSIIFSLILSIILTNCIQSQNTRVTNAYKEKEVYLQNLLKEKGINNFEINIILIGLKKERTLQVWVKNIDSEKYEHLIDYEFCSFSGELGPKREQGDLQIPEGFYHISFFNPKSKYHLSMQINYPNKSDRILGTKEKLGNDIFIHGACCTIGCIPITDDKIKELYVLCTEAQKNQPTQIPVYIFPSKLDNKNMTILKTKHKLELITFWENLQTGYNLFYKTKKQISFSINNEGKYVFK